MGVLTVADLMTRAVVTLEEEDTLLDAADQMRRFRVRHLPVVRDGRLVGILSQRDLLRLSPAGGDPEAVTRAQRRVRVGDAMTRELVTASPGTSLHAAAELMIDCRIGCLPVSDEEGLLRGLITSTDLLRLLSRSLAAMDRGPGHGEDAPERAP
jgi:CBS domain-containing protein